MKQTLRSAFVATIPVMTGYLVLGFGFGIIMKANGFGILMAFAMSLLIYAGSMQYVAVGLLTGGASILTAALTTLMVNARHLFYGISMLDRYKGVGKKKLYMIFGLCDETFSVNFAVDVPEGVDKGWFMFFVTILDHFYWFSGATLGAIFGSLISFNTEGLDFAMTAMFVVIFIEQWKKDRQHISALIGLGCSLAALWIFGAGDFLLPAMAAILALLTLARKPIDKAHLEEREELNP